jgi:nitrogen fixation NifU-like protein
MPSLDELYDDHILDHFECPYHKGQLANPTCSHCGKNPLCGDKVTVQIRVNDEGKIAEAWFDGSGCAISQAAASILCQHIEGKTVEEVENLQPQDMLSLLKVPLTATRQRCGLLSFKVLKTMLYSLDGKSVG